MGIKLLVLFLILLLTLISASTGQGWENVHGIERKSLLMGPFELPPHGMAMDTLDLKKPLDEEFAWVSYNTRVVDANGNDIQPYSVRVHHLVIISSDKRSIMCRCVQVFARNL
jgi:hypothetical protein